jgi:hypothetical protein
MSLFHAGIAPALDSNGNPISGATWNFYATESLTPAAVYADSLFASSLGVTVTANSAGRFVDIFLDDAVTYRAILKDAGGSTIKDIDPINAGTAVSLYDVNIRDYGAHPDLADNSAAILAALQASQRVYIPEGVYGCSSDVIELQQDDQTIYGAGTLAMNSAQTGTLLSTNGYRCTIEGIGLEGSVGGIQNAVVASSSDRNGLAIDMDKDSVLRGVRVTGFANLGIYARNTASDRTANLSVVDVTVRNCWMGIVIGQAKGEYTTWEGCKVSGCRFGVQFSSGNIAWTGGSINDNYRNVWILGTGVANNSHGSIVGTLLNHADEASIFADGVDFAFLIVGCNVFDGEIVLNNCNGVLIVGNTLDPTATRAGGATGGYNRVWGNTMVGDYDNVVSLNYGGFISTTELHQNYYMDGTLYEQHFVAKEGNSINVVGDQIDAFWYGIGSVGTDGIARTSNSSTGNHKLFPYNAEVLGSTPFMTFGTLTGKITQMRVSLSNFADDAAAAGGGIAVGELYRNGSVVMQRVA